MSISIFETSIVNMDSVKGLKFSIPTYQRPYVWGNEQLKKLLDDFHHAYFHNADASYYVSTFLTKDVGDKAELIDGQQRFTSLWLIAFVISQLAKDSSINTFLKKETELRFDFEIRQEVLNYLESLIDTTGAFSKKESFELEQQPYVINIAKGLSFIKSYFDTFLAEKGEEELNRFGDFIYQKVKLIKNTAPNNTDLNKLFSTINSAGVQLEQTDIIKANLLRLIDDKVLYSRIWEACENMNDYFERNVRRAFPHSEWKDKAKLNFNKYTPFNAAVFKYDIEENKENSKEATEFSLDNFDISSLASYSFPKTSFANENDRSSEEVMCRSVISFGQLLLHTYRLHLHEEGKEDFEGTFHANRLIEIFNSLKERGDTEEIKRFFHRLWNVRYLFDKYVIKWVSDSNTKQESLELVNINRNSEGYYTRTKYEKSESLMLQSVLYFTGDYLRQYWLTTYLGYLLEHHADLAATDSVHLSYLEKLDNVLSTTRSKKDKELTFDIIENGLKSIVPDVNIEDDLNKASGTGFKHYWFQKLEYILWKKWENKQDEKFKAYRITSRNSVEHIYPQNPENTIQHPQLAEDKLHSFGNLVLLSVAQNSEYSNKSVQVKRSMFKEKRETYDTLKSVEIFDKYEDWNSNSIESHKQDMINQLIQHYSHASN